MFCSLKLLLLSCPFSIFQTLIFSKTVHILKELFTIKLKFIFTQMLIHVTGKLSPYWLKLSIRKLKTTKSSKSYIIVNHNHIINRRIVSINLQVHFVFQWKRQLKHFSGIAGGRHVTKHCQSDSCRQAQQLGGITNSSKQAYSIYTVFGGWRVSTTADQWQTDNKMNTSLVVVLLASCAVVAFAQINRFIPVVSRVAQYDPSGKFTSR